MFTGADADKAHLFQHLAKPVFTVALHQFGIGMLQFGKDFCRREQPEVLGVVFPTVIREVIDALKPCFKQVT